MQRQLIVLSTEAIIACFFVVINGLDPRLVGDGSGGRRDRNVRFTTRTVTGAVMCFALLVDSTK
eukprot:4694671-Lingulodinium_polyedra.AAC.1